jgi:hypothetical protein
MVLMPTTFKTTTPLTAECSFNEFYGCGKYAIWAAGVPDAHFNNILAAFNSSAAWGGMPGWGFDSPRPVLNNPTFLYNGDGDSTYGAQMFLNMDRAVQVNGGLFVGTMAVHTHYETDFVMTGTMIRGKVLMDPTYWEFSGVLNQCDIGVTTLFKTVYPKRRNAAGLLRMKSCVRNSDGVSLTAHTGDYVAASYRDAFGLAGKPISTGGMLLTNPMPASGFLQFPTSVSTYANYVIAPAGRADLLSRWPLWIGFEKQAEWTRLTGTLGYEHGFPPGDYDVKLVSQDCKTVIATKRIKIVSGAVTKF